MPPHVDAVHASVDETARAGSTAAPRRLSPILTIGRGGWTIYFPTKVSPTGSKSKASLSHYGDTWREHLSELAPDAIAIDSTAVDDDHIVIYAVSGPIVDADLPPGTVLPFPAMGHGPRPWHPDLHRPGRDPRFGDAGGFDYVAPDVAAAIGRRFGARIFHPHAEPRPVIEPEATNRSHEEDTNG